MLKKFITFLLLFVFCFNFQNLYASNNIDDNHMNVVLVIDTSGSMNGNDPNHIAVEGVKLFIDMMEYSGSKVGVIGFNGKVTFEIPLTTINSTQDKTNLKNKIDNINYNGYTDMGMALKKAESILFQGGTLNDNSLMVMFTDGYVEVDPKTNRSVAESENEIEQVLLGAKSKYPIYTIGLNTSNRVDKKLITKIADETNGDNYMTNDAKELPEIFNNIFAKHIKSNVLNIGSIVSDGVNYNNIDINIPNNSVAEANIILYSQQQLLDVMLKNPQGTNLELNASNKIYLSQSKMYSVIKIINPEKGNWVLSVKGVKDDQIKINLLYNYTISLNASLQNQNVVKGSNITIIGNLLKDNQKLIDDDLVSTFNADLEIYENNTLIEKIPMSVKGSEFLADYKLPLDKNNLSFIIKASGSGFYRESNTIDLDISNSKPTVINEAGSKLFLHFPVLFNNYKINPQQYFEDKDDTNLKYSIIQNKNTFNVKETPDKIILSAKNPFFIGSSEIDIICTDSEGETATTVNKIIGIPILGILLIPALVILIVMLRKVLIPPPPFKGTTKTVVIIGGIYGEPVRTELVLHRGPLSVSKCIKPSDILDLSELDKITFTQSKGMYALDFVNNSSYEIHSVLKEEKTFTLEQGKTITIINNQDDIEISFSYLE